MTNEQFNAFVLDEDGYSNDKWWTKDGIEWKESNSVPPTLATLPKNSPQNCVTWFEAVAFCRWYSAKTKTVVRLPSEAEWEYAARGNSGFQFTWGNNCDTIYANVKTSNIGHVTSVGCFPSNAKDGQKIKVYDMNGNLWEWCSSLVEFGDGEKFIYPYNPEDGRENIELSGLQFRATRGGYYDGDWMYARSCYRGRDIPSLRAERQGFRVVRELV